MFGHSILARILCMWGACVLLFKGGIFDAYMQVMKLLYNISYQESTNTEKYECSLSNDNKTNLHSRQGRSDR